MNPDEDGGIEPDTNVSFIVIPAKKGLQAAVVTIADPPKDEKSKDKESEPALEKSFGDMGFGGEDDGFGDPFASDDKNTASETKAAEVSNDADDNAWDF